MIRILLAFSMMTFASISFGAEAPQSITELGCLNCHGLNEKVVGPSWTEIAHRYRDRNSDPATLETLVKNVSRGSRDNWGSLPMVGSDPTGKKRDQVVAAVQYILALPEQPPAPATPSAVAPSKRKP